MSDIGKIAFDAYEQARVENGAPAPRAWDEQSSLDQECWRFAGVRAVEHILRIRALHVAGIPIPKGML